RFLVCTTYPTLNTIKCTSTPLDENVPTHRTSSCPLDRQCEAKAQISDNEAYGTSKSRRDRIESEIVLLNTESDFNNIKCISIPFDENVPEYYAISYQWGVHSEWKARTPNYEASITSVLQRNLIKLCKYYRRRIRYLWIDVVCIYQTDKKPTKTALKIIHDIYRKADRIIAVPDLCYCAENPFMDHVTKEDIESTLISHMQARAKNFHNHPDVVKLFDENEPRTYSGIRLDYNELDQNLKPWNRCKPWDRWREKCRGPPYCPFSLLTNGYPNRGREFIERVTKE
ncbi:hypothetical protein EC973_005786, partial [Apophysomyces ossiformis]